MAVHEGKKGGGLGREEGRKGGREEGRKGGGLGRDARLCEFQDCG
jgi:hypothetical protein